MPVSGFPAILENALSTLLKESKLSSYKVVGHQNDSTTVVLRFFAIPDTAHELPPCPPRSPVLKLTPMNKTKTQMSAVCNTPITEQHQKPLPSPQAVCYDDHTETLENSQQCDDSGVDVSDTHNRNSGLQRTKEKQMGQYSKVRRSPSAHDPLISDTPLSGRNVGTPPVDTPPDHERVVPETRTPITVDDQTKQDGKVTKKNNEEKALTTPSSLPNTLTQTSETKRNPPKKSDPGRLFHNENYLNQATRNSQTIPAKYNTILKSTRRNSIYTRVAKCQRPQDEGPALLVQTVDLYYVLFLKSKTIGPMQVIYTRDDDGKEQDYSYWTKEFKKWPTIYVNDHSEHSDILKSATKQVIDFVLEHSPK